MIYATSLLSPQKHSGQTARIGLHTVRNLEKSRTLEKSWHCYLHLSRLRTFTLVTFKIIYMNTPYYMYIGNNNNNKKKKKKKKILCLRNSVVDLVLYTLSLTTDKDSFASNCFFGILLKLWLYGIQNIHWRHQIHYYMDYLYVKKKKKRKKSDTSTIFAYI